MHPRGKIALVLHQYRLSRSHRRRDPHRHAGRADDPQRRDARTGLAQGLRGLECRYRAGVRPSRSRPDRKGHVGDAGFDGGDAGAENRAGRGGRQHRLGAVAHRCDAARDALSQGQCLSPPTAAFVTPPRKPRRYFDHPACPRRQLVARGSPAGARQQRARHSWLCRALDRSGHRLLEGSGHQQCRADGGSCDVAHFQPAHRQLAAARHHDRASGHGYDATHGASGRPAECRRSGLFADGAELCDVDRLRRGVRSGLQGRGAAERLYRADPACAPRRV